MKKVLLLLPLVFVTACASLDIKAEKIVHDSIVQSEVAHNAKLIDDNTFKLINADLYKAAVAGEKVTVALHAKANADWVALFNAIQLAIDDIQKSNTGNKLGDALGKLQQLEAKIKGSL